jgi:hypothetical protein
MNNPAPPQPPPYWSAIVEFDYLAAKLKWLAAQKRERELDLERRGNQSPHAFLRLQAD